MARKIADAQDAQLSTLTQVDPNSDDFNDSPNSPLGASLGFVYGFLTRPSAFLIDQLPLSVVLSRGATLQGLEALYIPTAQLSFNHCVAWSIIGLTVGLVIGVIVRRATAPDGAANEK